MTTNEVYLTRLKALRDEGFPLARKAEKEGHLDFGTYVSDCGTYRCLLGWWIETPTAKADGWRINSNRLLVWGVAEEESSAGDYFGLNFDERVFLFGDYRSRSLLARRRQLTKLITYREELVAHEKEKGVSHATG